MVAGDYTLLEKLFGQTSNNAERMKLKQEVLDKANIPTNPELVSVGLACPAPTGACVPEKSVFSVGCCLFCPGMPWRR